jgi:hypothetical protein
MSQTKRAKDAHLYGLWHWLTSGPKLVLVLMVGLAVNDVSARASVCQLWPELPFQAMRLLQSCQEPPVQRQIGQLCVQVQWRCSQTPFEKWLQEWFKQIEAPIEMHLLNGKWFFTGVDVSNPLAPIEWSLSWLPSREQPDSFAVLISRLRPAGVGVPSLASQTKTPKTPWSQR